MSENTRFKIAYEKGNWWAVRDGDITLWKEEVIHLLNELHDENKNLKLINKTQNNELQRQRRRTKRLHKDWDRLYEYLINEKIMAEDEILKVI